VTDALKEPLRISGTPVVNLMASTSGTDADFVVKIIDVFPESAADGWKGYELPLAIDTFRGRYRKSFEKPEAFTLGQPDLVKFDLPQVNHTFLPGHRCELVAGARSRQYQPPCTSSRRKPHAVVGLLGFTTPDKQRRPAPADYMNLYLARPMRV